jgi:hypothetical protein
VDLAIVDALRVQNVSRVIKAGFDTHRTRMRDAAKRKGTQEAAEFRLSGQNERSGKDPAQR